METTLSALRGAALARPDDLAAHLVYADALMEAGDPLGAWMARQCSDPSVEVPHGVARGLLGRLYSQATSWRIVRGVLREVRLRRCTPRDFRRLIGLGEWEGVRAVSFERGLTPRTQRLPAEEVALLVRHEACQGLTEVLELDDESLRHLADLPRTFERLSLVHESRRETPISPVQLRARVLELRSSPPRLPDWLFGVGRALVERVEALSLPEEGAAPLALLGDLPPNITRVTTPELSAERLADGWTARLEPKDLTAANVDWRLLELVSAIHQARRSHARVEVHLPDHGPGVLDRLRAAADGTDLSLVLTGPGEPLRGTQYEGWEADAPF